MNYSVYAVENSTGLVFSQIVPTEEQATALVKELQKDYNDISVEEIYSTLDEMYDDPEEY